MRQTGYQTYHGRGTYAQAGCGDGGIEDYKIGAGGPEERQAVYVEEVRPLDKKTLEKYKPKKEN